MSFHTHWPLSFTTLAEQTPAGCQLLLHRLEPRLIYMPPRSPLSQHLVRSVIFYTSHNPKAKNLEKFTMYKIMSIQNEIGFFSE